jgi:uncharacterized protein (DUF1501 family)
MKRRDFLKNTSLASSLFLVPSFVSAFDKALMEKYGHKRLIIVQLAGGNDGLNTVVPYRNDIYYNSRPTIALKKTEVIKVTDELGFHPSLQPLKSLYDQGYLSIINNVGYPNPDRSHFRSTDIWQTASSSSEYLQTGWIGRFLDTQNKNPYGAIEVDDSLSLALKGNTINGLAVTDAKRLYQSAQAPFLKKVLSNQTDTHLSEHNLGYLYQTLISAESSAKYIYDTTKTYTTVQEYPNTKFSKQLKTVAEFINSGLDTSVYFTSLNGFDSHAGQLNSQKRLLNDYAQGIESLVKDLKQNGTFKDTLIITFSEFGRRVEQNAAAGTDHGAANNVFIIGEHLKKQGLYNDMANLNDLDDNGDLKFEIDFRTIYSTILNKWMDVSDKEVLNQSFDTLDFI